VNDTTQQPDPAVAALQPRRAGEILAAALELYGRHPLTLMALVAAMVVPLGVLNGSVALRPTQGMLKTQPQLIRWPWSARRTQSPHADSAASQRPARSVRAERSG